MFSSSASSEAGAKILAAATALTDAVRLKKSLLLTTDVDSSVLNSLFINSPI